MKQIVIRMSRNVKKIIYSVVDFMKMMIYNIRREGWKVHFDELFEMRKLTGIKFLPVWALARIL